MGARGGVGGGTPAPRPKGKVLASYVWEAFSFDHGRAADLFRELKADYRGEPVSIRTYRRTVSAGGVALPVVACIVREK